MSRRLIPPAMIGIVGGGQLGRMMALSAIATGYKIAVLDPDPACPCAHLADLFICASYDDEIALNQLSEKSDILTYEFENADANMVKKHGNQFPQGHLALEISQHRLLEKNFALENKVPCPQFSSISSRVELDELAAFPFVLKTCRFGYDGKGQWLIKNKDDLDQIKFPGEYIAEEYVAFNKEISVVCCRFKNGTTVYEPFENRHVNGILSETIHPAMITEKTRHLAIEATKRLVDALDYIGVLAVEYFVVDDGILFNEMAPRPHNSAHATIEDDRYSQFDLHIAAITGSDQLVSHPRGMSMMINILGQNVESVLWKWEHLPTESVHLHMYGKDKNRIGRKMGHITICADTYEDSLRIAKPWRNNE
jgi:5-(carboxyamino)imidazole ribonucleotide synthase